MTRPIEDITPLTDLQAGMVFHAAERPDAPDPYTVQLTVVIEAGARPVEPLRWRRAVDALVARHASLRTLFVHEGLESPVAVVRRDARPAWAVEDHTQLTEAAAERRYRAHHDAERARRFALDREIPVRAALHLLPGGRARLALTLHHLVVDGWSVPVLLDDLIVLHDADGEAGTLPPAPAFRPYLDWIAAQDTETSLAAWDTTLAGLEPLRLASAAPSASAAPRSTVVEMSAERTAALTAAARAGGWTTSTLLQVAWGLVLGRVSGRRDVVFGGTVSGRPPALADVERAVGLFITTLPVRVDAAPGDRIADVLDTVARAQADLSAHQHVGLGRLQRRLGRGTLFDTTLVVENLPGAGGAAEPVSTAGVRVVDVEARDSTHYPLTVVAIPGERLRVRFDHHPDALDPDLVKRLAEMLEGALDAIAAGTGRRVADLVLVPDGVRARVRRAGSGAAVDVGPGTLTERLSEAARRRPGGPAVIAAGTVLDHAGLHARAHLLARRLIAAGAGPERVVAVAVSRRPELVVALLGVLHAGAAYLPLDMEAPVQRRAQLLADARPAAVLTAAGEPDAGTGDEPGPPVLTVDLAEPGDPRPVTGAERGAPLTPDSLAYLIYTSGSTGRPKGVGVSHGAVVNRLEWMQDAYRLDPGERVLQKTPSTFDVSVWEFFWPLLQGAALVLAAPGDHRDPARLAATIVEHDVGTVHFVPTMLEAFLAGLDGPAADAVGRTLRRVVCSGEGLPPAVRDRALRRWDGVELHNLYGPTEAAVDVTADRCVPGTDDVPIGRPVWNTRCRVLDATLAEVPPGVVGELYLAGDQLARGYPGRPALTAGRFVADPAGPPGTRMYRTGDLARWGEDGLLRHAGRVDDQVKIRGQRVEPGEVEAVLGALPGVEAAAVIAVPDATGAPQLVAYVVAGDPGPLRDALAARLPAAMVPSAVVAVPTLPVTAHGKLDRAALPAPGRPEGGGRGPRTTTESVVCRVLASALGRDSVGAEDDFFALGGHSMLVLRVAAELRQALGVPVDVRTVVEHPSAAALARRLTTGALDEGSPLDTVLRLRAGGDAPPLVCVHPAAGLSWCYLGLLGTLDPSVPVWGLQARELVADPGEAPSGIAERAADFVARIRALRPHGPYRLLGWSVGGRIAHEMAAQLEDAGEDVDLVVVLDAYPHTTLAATDRDTILADASARTDGAAADADPAQRVRAALGDHDWLDDDTAERVLRTYVSATGALVGAEPSVRRGDMVFFGAEHAGDDYRPEQWRPYLAGDLVCHATGRRHDEMADPAVLSAVGTALTEILADREATTDGGEHP
ncbi:amino acid adenylation domain-containing protein [Pseudonocardia sediminis]|uniref:Amino acid adenylation domain-containing protein n=1 Tax=Pseudonocardia sediminis TaxID=1397368 RepID=A0A4Q7V7C5_PSEST|nr:non-ribosomal peptide synthetase [Pseudonocardia sediminis]RZT88649.1 amino acid adenylation domain-containing protein [Pseudonocardia sediminis]